MSEEIVELSNFKQSGWKRLDNFDVTVNDLSCDCTCPNKPNGRHIIRISYTRKEEVMCTSDEGLQKLMRDKITEGLQRLAEYECPENL